MSEQTKPSRYMQELDAWTEENVITPILQAWPRQDEDDDPISDEAVAIISPQVKKAIRGKVLDSYHNGQKAGQRPRR
jgi:hypothetical protein